MSKFDLSDLNELVKILRENNLTEVWIERRGIKIGVKKEKAVVSYQDKKEDNPDDSPETSSKHSTIDAPMVGIFHRSSSSNLAPFVNVGGAVKKGQTVCVIEAMKLINEVKSEIKGKIIRILVEDGEPVEYGQSLFLIEPSE